MVSFQCDGCADTVKKPQLDKHRQRCWAPFTCLDCSATFHGQDYKSHTSCVTEAEKYQGALYKGPKTALVKGAHAPRSGQASRSATASAAVSGAATPADSPAPSESSGAGTSAIHPSRLNQLAAGPVPERDFGGGRGRGFGRGGGFNARGRGAFARGGGGFGFGGATRERYSATGENKLAPEGGMRTWGSAPASEAATDSEAPTPAPASAAGAGDEDKKKKKKRKGDKGGTGAKANSRVKTESEAGDEPQSKKRKRDDDADEAAPAPAERAPPSDKTLKRLRKHMGKLEGKTPSASVSLAQWLELVAKGKDKTLDHQDVLQGVHVTFTDGQWTLAA